MSSAGETLTPARWPSVHWPSIFAGAVVAAGVSFTLHAFAIGIGLSVASTAPTWRDSSPLLWVLSGLYLLLVALLAFGAAGYVAARMRPPFRLINTTNTEMHDGFHGLVAWALAILFTAVLAMGAAAMATPAMTPSGEKGAHQSLASENIIASQIDELFRTDRTIADIDYRRAEAGRILLKSSSHAGVPAADREYLAVVTANSVGQPLEAATRRVDRAVASSRVEIRRARVAAVLQAFWVAAALALGAGAAWMTAIRGGRERDEAAPAA